MSTCSEEVIAAKENEVSDVTSKWVPPTETGLEHSAAIADSSAVAIGPGGASDGGGAVKRVFKSVGAFDKEGTGDATAPAENPPVMKVSQAAEGSSYNTHPYPLTKATGHNHRISLQAQVSERCFTLCCRR